MSRYRCIRVLAAVACVTAAAASAVAQNPGGGGMPDPRQMSGIPLPLADMPAGTVTVRVVKGSLANAVPNHPVELRGAGRSLRASTDTSGRAKFNNVSPGARVTAFTDVAGEKLESQEFQVPASGGIRLMLVATDPAAAAGAAEDNTSAQAPAQPGTVVLGDQSRFVIELADDSLSVFNILQILNGARVPVQPAQPVVFELPEDAEGATVLEGSAPETAVEGRRVIVAGPFAPGSTLVQFAYSLPYSGDRVTLEQRLPIQLASVAVLAQKVGEMHLASPQFSAHREMNAEGQTYLIAQGPAIAAGQKLTVAFTGLPHAPTWPRNVALGLAVLILAAGAWGSVRSAHGAAAPTSRRGKLQQRRERVFDELTSLEEQHKAGRVALEHYTSRRRDLVAALERIYGEIDEEATA